MSSTSGTYTGTTGEREGSDDDAGQPTDILWTLNHPDVWLLLVDERGWTPEQRERWFADAACAQLLGG